MLDIPCVIFAGGKSSRMGEDKALLPFAGFNTLTEFQLTRLSKIFTTVYISCKDKNKFSFSADFIEDKKVENIFAPTLAFVSIFESLQVENFFAISVDSPFIDTSIIEKIVASDSVVLDATVAQNEDGIQPLCGVYHRSLLSQFEAMIAQDNHKLTHLLKNSNTHYVAFKNDHKFLNLNHPHEYKKALTLSQKF